MSESKIYTIPDGNNSIDPALMLALSLNGGFGNGANWMWPMFMFFLFPWLFNGGMGGFGGFGNNAGNLLGTGFLSNQITDNQATDTLLQAINGRADAASQLAQLTHANVNQVEGALNTIQSAIATLGGNLGISGQQIINSVQAGNASLSQLLCECCCNMRYDLAQLTNALQAQAALNASAAQLLLANHDANVRLQLAQNEAADLLAVCQQTNDLKSQASGNTNSILSAIQAQNAMITKEFCDLKERELQNKIDTQGDIITQLRNQISNDRQTLQFNAAFHALDDKVDNIAAKLPNTVPVTWPNLTAVNNTPNIGGYPYGYGYGYNNGFGGGIIL